MSMKKAKQPSEKVKSKIEDIENFQICTAFHFLNENVVSENPLSFIKFFYSNVSVLYAQSHRNI